jgi:ribosomal peptide maturation radical SAM protein 1
MSELTNKILLIVPPFAAVDYPMLGPSTLATACRARNVDAEVYYANLQLAAQLGYDLYTRISLSSLSLMAGEVLFKDSAFADLPAQQLSSQILKHYFASHELVHISNPDLAPLTHDELLIALREIKPLVEHVAKEIGEFKPAIVGFSSVFQQNLASVALARAVRERLPGVITVLGGANASFPMGTALRNVANVFDYVFSGEADHSFPEFVQSYIEKGVLPQTNMIECPPVEVLDGTPIPDFSDFFQQLKCLHDRGLLLELTTEALPMETSRGCWWGAKKHCTFCGLNGTEMNYRAKTPNRILHEFTQQINRYDIKRFQITDNIMPLNFRTEVLPELAARGQQLQIFYEVKSNLKSEELDLFVRAGIRFIQPGIESFSSNLLRLIDKGVTGVQNIWLLRECLSRQIEVLWNLLVGIPDESLADYTRTLRLLPYLEHLQPPRACSPIVIDRYSPYHSLPDKYGIKSVKPFPAYQQLYPPDANLSDISYHFTGEYDSEYLANAEFRASFESSVKKWIASWVNGTRPKLYAVPLDRQRLFVEDTRSCAVEQRVALDAAASNLARLLQTPRRARDLLPESLPALHELMERCFVVKHEDFYLSLLTEPQIGIELRRMIH